MITHLPTSSTPLGGPEAEATFGGPVEVAREGLVFEV